MSTKRQIRNWSLFSSLPPPVFILVFRPFLWKKSLIKIRGAWKLGRVTLLRKHSGGRMDEKKRAGRRNVWGGEGREEEERWSMTVVYARAISMTMHELSVPRFRECLSWASSLAFRHSLFERPRGFFLAAILFNLRNGKRMPRCRGKRRIKKRCIGKNWFSIRFFPEIPSGWWDGIFKENGNERRISRRSLESCGLALFDVLR